MNQESSAGNPTARYDVKAWQKIGKKPVIAEIPHVTNS